MYILASALTDTMESSSRPRSTSPAGASPSSTPPYRAVVSEDSDDYVDNQNQNKHQEASTSTAISLGADTEGLRERNRAPYSASTVPKREEVSPASTAPEQVPSSSYSSTASDKGKQKAKDEADGQDTSSNENPFACHIW